MAKCGITKYDKLPGRVGFIDVDYLRWRLYRCYQPAWHSNIPILKLFHPPTDKVTQHVIETRLEEALEKNHGG